jgi:hypothetical protein
MDLHNGFGHQDEGDPLIPMEVSKSYALGVHRFQLDGGNQVLGWKLSDRWYLGRQRGDDSGLALVWQHQRTRFALTRDGVRLTRNF